jgi:hypothetical protein
MKIKELLEGRHGYDDAGYSLAPGHDEGEPVYSRYHDRIGDGGPSNYRQHNQQVDVPHDVHINGRKWKSFGSHSHASNVAKKIKGATVHKATEGVEEGAQQAAIAIAKKASGKYDKDGKRLKETATAGATSAANVGVGAVYKNKPVKQPKNKDGTAKNAVDMNVNLLTGGSIKR